MTEALAKVVPLLISYSSIFKLPFTAAVHASSSSLLRRALPVVPLNVEVRFETAFAIVNEISKYSSAPVLP